MVTPRAKLVCLTTWVMRASCSRPAFLQCLRPWAAARRPSGAVPGFSMNFDTWAFCLRVIAGDEHVPTGDPRLKPTFRNVGEQGC